MSVSSSPVINRRPSPAMISGSARSGRLSLSSISRPCFEDGRSPVNVGKVERGHEDLTSDSCGAAMGEYIKGVDDVRPPLLPDSEVWTRVLKTRSTIRTLFGKVTCERHRCCRAGSPSPVPVDEQLGLAIDCITEPAGELTVLLQQSASGAHSDLWRRIGGMTQTESTLQHLGRLPKPGTKFRECRCCLNSYKLTP